MAFTYVTISHTYRLAGDLPAAGKVVFEPVEPMHNGITVVSAASEATLNASGQISQKLAANTDPGTYPAGTTYRVTEQITDQPARVYHVQVPHDEGSALDLGSLTGWAGGVPPAGAVLTINTEAPDLAGNIVLGASDVGAQPLDADLTAVAALGDGYPRRDAGVWGVRTATELRGDISAQLADADLTALAGLGDGHPWREAGVWQSLSNAQLLAQLLTTALLGRLPAALQYFFPISMDAAEANGSLGIGTLRVAPWLVPHEVTIDRIGSDIATAGDVGSVFRPGIYADNGNAYPGALELDGGTIAGDSATVQNTSWTGPLVLTPGLHWIGGVVQLVTTTQPTVRAVSGWNPPVPISLGTGLPTANMTTVAYSTTGVTGALPSSFPVGAAAAGSAPRIHVRRSA